ncbi:MAG: hypothetical protein P1P84_02605 [Deferrisomatales bacterium]|nr:hypothetical protein [Deferrisomatales bacterium]
MFRDLRSGIARINYSLLRCANCEHCPEPGWMRDGVAQVVRAIYRGETMITEDRDHADSQ